MHLGRRWGSSANPTAPCAWATALPSATVAGSAWPAQATISGGRLCQQSSSYHLLFSAKPRALMAAQHSSTACRASPQHSWLHGQPAAVSSSMAGTHGQAPWRPLPSRSAAQPCPVRATSAPGRPTHAACLSSASHPTHGHSGTAFLATSLAAASSAYSPCSRRRTTLPSPTSSFGPLNSVGSLRRVSTEASRKGHFQYQYEKITVKASIKKTFMTGDKGYRVMQVQVDEDSWTPHIEAIIRQGNKLIDASENPWERAAAEPSALVRKLTVQGKALQVAEEGQRFRIIGHWRHHSKYGARVEVERLMVIPPESDGDLEAMLMNLGKGIGKKVAESIVDRYHASVLEILDLPKAEAVKQLKKVHGVGPVTARNIKELWDNRTSRQSVVQLLHDLGVRLDVCSSIIQHITKMQGGTITVDQVEALLKQDPWAVLFGASGTVFKDAEELAIALDVTRGEQPSRARFALIQALTFAAAAHGHTCVPWYKVRWEADKQLTRTISKVPGQAIPESVLMKSAYELEQQKEIVLEAAEGIKSGQSQPSPSAEPRTQISKETRCYLEPFYRAETELATAIAERACGALKRGAWKPRQQQQQQQQRQQLEQKQGTVSTAAPGAGGEGSADLVSELSFGSKLTPTQQAAVQLAQEVPLMLLTGSAGCGKTLTAKEIVAKWVADGKTVAVCAPTGRAAQRLQQLLDLPQVEARTVHRLLGYFSSREEQQQQEEQLQEQQQDDETASAASGSAGSDAATPPLSDDEPSFDEVCQDLSKMVKYNESEPLPYDAVLLDEASMLDLQMAYVLLAALRPSTQLVLVGDPNQLAPVGPGHVLTALLALRLEQLQQPAEKAQQPVLKQQQQQPLVPQLAAARSGPASQLQSAPRTTRYAPAPPRPLYSANGYGTSAVPGAKVADAGRDGALAPGQAVPGWALLPRVQLDEIFRQANGGAIVEGALQITRAQHPSAMKKILPQDLLDILDDLSLNSATSGAVPVGPDASPEVAELAHLLGSDALLLELPDSATPAEVEDAVVELVKRLEAMGVDTHTDVQVLSPVKGKLHHGGHGPNSCTVASLNARLQPVMNPSPVPALDRSRSGQAGAKISVRELTIGGLRLNDRVVQLKNNYEKDVYNGDIGVVLQIKPGVITVRFQPRPGSDEPYDVLYSSQEVYELQQAWCTTVHKSQGGEYPCTVVALHHEMGSPLHTRQLLYTAVTRARQLLLLVCTKSALARCLQKDECEGGDKADILAQRIVSMVTANAAPAPAGASPPASSPASVSDNGAESGQREGAPDEKEKNNGNGDSAVASAGEASSASAAGEPKPLASDREAAESHVKLREALSGLQLSVIFSGGKASGRVVARSGSTRPPSAVSRAAMAPRPAPQPPTKAPTKRLKPVRDAKTGWSLVPKDA